MLWVIFLSFPLPLIAILTGWYTAEVGRQPWTVYGVLRTADAVTPFLTASAAMTSLDPVRRGLRLHLLVRHVLHLSAAARRPGGTLAAGRSTFPCPIGRCRSPIRCRAARSYLEAGE